MTPPLWLIKAGAIIALLAVVAGYGYHHGAKHVQAKWDKQAAEDRAAAATQAESDRLRSRAAASDYETKRAANARRAATPSPEAAYALHATICPPAGAFSKPLELGDVPVPGAVLQRLRESGADY